MAITNFIPKIWSARLLENLHNELVYAKLLNNDYEGEITAYGDTVHIGQVGAVATKKYTRNADIDPADELSTSDQTLVIDQGQYFNIGIDDVDKAQARTSIMDKAMAEASYSLATDEDKYIAGLLAKGTLIKDLGNTSTPLVINSGDLAYKLLVDMKVALDKANVPKQGRWVVMPPEFEGLMLLDPRFAYNTPNSNSRLENGEVARAAGFGIHISNNVPNTGSAKYKIIASYNGAGTRAEQILKTEAYRPEKRFSDAVKGLHVYGAKITRPNEVAVATVNFAEVV